MSIWLIATFVTAALVFLVLRPRYKVLLALFVMTVCFDLVPRMIANRDVWDAGAIMLLIAWAQLLASPPRMAAPTALYARALMIFIAWMGFALLWSLLVYRYPLLDTLKACRALVIGYLSFFVLARLYRVDPGSLGFLKKAFYLLTFALLPVCVVQYVLGVQILSGLVKEYDGVIRGLPVFLPFCLLYFWYIASRMFSGERTALHEKIYAALTLAVTALTFTRGIYFAVFLAFAAMLVLLLRDRRLSASASLVQILVAILGVGGLLFTGALDRVVSRVASGIDILVAGRVDSSREDVDTFSGRLALTGERFELVMERNPLVGYGFIHEENVPQSLRNRFRYGSIIQTPAYREKYELGYPYVLSLLSVDIGWADIVVKTGLVGFALFVFFIATLLLSYFHHAAADGDAYHFRLACYLQLFVAVLTMFNGNPLVGHVQIACFLLAGFLYSSGPQAVPALASQPRYA